MNVYILAKASMFDKIYAVINIPGSTTCVPFSISSGSSSTSSWLDDISAQNIIRNKYLQSVPEDENSFRCSQITQPYSKVLEYAWFHARNIKNTSSMRSIAHVLALGDRTTTSYIH